MRGAYVENIQDWHKRLLKVCCYMSITIFVIQMLIYIIFEQSNAFVLSGVIYPTSINVMIILGIKISSYKWAIYKDKKETHLEAISYFIFIGLSLICGQLVYLHYTILSLAYTLMFPVYLTFIIGKKSFTRHIAYFNFILLDIIIIKNLIHFKGDTYVQLLSLGMIIAFIGSYILVEIFQSYFTNLILSYRAIENQLKIDPMTGVLNRKAFFYELDELLLNVQDEYISLAMLDIDNFKTINDTFGHLAGDEVILTLVDIITNHSDKDMIFGRYGGEEFVILFKNHSMIEAVTICEAIRENFAGKILEATQCTSVTVSIGISTYTYKFEESIDFIMAADTALYKAKENGKNRIVIC